MISFDGRFVITFNGEIYNYRELRAKLEAKGYIFRSSEGPSIYLEPHVEFDPDELARLAPVDVVITPTSGQSLAGFELVHGPEAAAGVPAGPAERPRRGPVPFSAP